MDPDSTQFIFSIAVLVFSVVAHEVSHGYMADWLGDTTARRAGRLTMNPVPHIDPIGSILVPVVMSLIPHGIVFGWAKPVPYNPYNLRDQRWGEAKVAAAGPLTNFTIALVFGLLMRFGASTFSGSVLAIMQLIVLINLVLALFNLFPIPPLDGSKVLASILPHRLRYIEEYLERYSLIFLIFFVYVLWGYMFPVVTKLYGLITGFSV